MDSNVSPTRCASSSCADVEVVDGGVIVTSTVTPDRGRVFLDSTEWGRFVEAVKAGAFDVTVGGPIGTNVTATADLLAAV